MTATVAATRIEMRDLRKRYGSTIALNGLDLDMRAGEVLGIAGPNGAGKSTLMRLLAGEERADGGEVRLDGSVWSPTDAVGVVAVVHQEPQLFPNLTVAENLMVGREGRRVLRPTLGESDLALMQSLRIADFARLPLAACTLATQQRAEIARALATDARVFLFDEPNSALTDDESDELFREVHRLADSGHVVILVTHRLSDLVEHADRVAVIRDGRVTATLAGETLTEDSIAQQLVLGGELEREAVVHDRSVPKDKAAPAGFSVSNWRDLDGEFAPTDMAVEAGQIVALMGVEGSGARELLRSFAGLENCSGEINIGGSSGMIAVGRLTAYVPATRQFSLYTNLSVGENLLVRLGQPDIAGAGTMLKRSRMRAMAEDAVKRFLVRTRTISQGIRSLSGGNQQKVAIAQALVRQPKLILLEEPTRGVDIKSKGEIYRLLREFAYAGNVVLMYCTEVLEMFEAADSVFVVSDGRLSRPIQVKHFDHVEALATEVTKLERHTRQSS